ncbi:LruC domain-containing protein [Bacteroides sp. YC-2022]|uniref:LruC domain-containing protein n=1 Tax=Bacteroides sp. 47 TaxID=3016008 RepID=UPI0022EAD437|nr:LruC domain-containing protein [Bacteroides sp. 47]MDA3622117.1 LruC domain-containing protein [Bacteroides sp. 47]
MKTAMYTLAGLMCLLTSCVEDDKDLSVPTAHTTDLVIPDGFDWSTTRNVTLATNAPHAISTSIYLDKACSEQIADLAIPEGGNSASLEVPSANNAIWIKYPVTNGGYETQKISIKSKATTRSESYVWTADCLFPDRGTVESGWPASTVYKPAKNGYGTLMFEDMWPEMGDYDFNDFVINYRAQTTWGGSSSFGKNSYLDITISLKLRAMGGSLPYRFCIQLPGKATDMEGDPISSPTFSRELIKDFKIESATKGIGVEFLANTQSPIFALTGLNNLKGTDGNQFYNTQAGKLIASSAETPTLVFSFKLQLSPETASSTFGNFSTAYDFDYFLQNTNNGREIHFVGFKPTELYKGYETDRKEAGKNYYCNKGGFVWALKAPVEMGWAVEKIDLLGVYPRFKSWLENGGSDLTGEPDIPGSGDPEGESNKESRWYNYPEGSSYINPQKH